MKQDVKNCGLLIKLSPTEAKACRHQFIIDRHKNNASRVDKHFLSFKTEVDVQMD